MKKILAILSALGLITTTSMTVMACQIQISGDTLETLSQKFNEGQENQVLIMANVNLENPQALKKSLVQKLTKVLVDQYQMDKEGFFLDSDFQEITIGDFKLMENKKLISLDKIPQQEIVGLKLVKMVIADVSFRFNVNFQFDQEF